MQTASLRFHLQNILVHTPPPKERGDKQLAADKAEDTARVASPRVVIENLLARPKNLFHILGRPLPVAQLDMLGPIMRVCCFLTNYMPALRRGTVDVPDGAVAAADAAGGAAASAAGAKEAVDAEYETWQDVSFEM